MGEQQYTWKQLEYILKIGMNGWEKYFIRNRVYSVLKIIGL